jgi:hypothetical protein
VSQLVEFLHERYGVAVGVDELVPGNFRTVRAIEAFVVSKRGARC